MRIAQVAPLFESVPPRLYGGTERVVAYLTEELVRMGHDVTLFASGDSRTSARLLPCTERALRLGGAVDTELTAHSAMLQKVHARSGEFDVIHLHVDDWPTREPRLFETSHLTTVHGRIDTPERLRMFAGHPALALVSISNAQRAPLPQGPWLATVHHGLPRTLYTPREHAGAYLAFVGRVSAEKRVDRAIDIAGRFGMTLQIAAKVDNADFPYYQRIKHKLKEPWVEFVGEVDEAQKNELLGGAYAMLFPIDWPEPFGLSMIEAMFCGTPVVAFDRGSAREVVREGVTGFVVRSLDESLVALRHIERFDRKRCAEAARKAYDARRMADDYLRLYGLRAGTHVPLPLALACPTGDQGHARPGE